jgi:hypothetical protein
MTAHKLYLKAGYHVSAMSFTHQKIIGNYVRGLPSLGCIIHGSPENSTEPPQDHKCYRMTVELRKLEKPKKSKGRPSPISVKVGEACEAITKEGHPVKGAYAGLGPKPYAYIRTFTREGVFTHKVSRESVKKTLD